MFWGFLALMIRTRLGGGLASKCWPQNVTAAGAKCQHGHGMRQAVEQIGRLAFPAAVHQHVAVWAKFRSERSSQAVGRLIGTTPAL